MTELSRRAFLAAIAASVPLSLAACSSSSSNSSATSSKSSQAAEPARAKHVIGVAVYDVADDEVVMFRRYLVDYVASICFDDVQFVYSKSITSEQEMLDFIDDVAELGGEGFMSFYNIDLQAEVERCAQHKMYHMVASGTVSEEDFKKVEDNEFFLGAIGPMIEMEYNAGASMVRNYVPNKVGDRYFIMSGGAALGNEMHYQRTLGILDMLETSYGVDLGKTKELAAVTVPTTVSNDALTITVAPGYVSIESMREPVVKAFESAEYDVVLAALPVEPVITVLDKRKPAISQVDCYSQDNQLRFEAGRLNYLVGKYGSIVGPSFVAMYNAITGHAAAYRDNGKAFKIVQTFWESGSAEDFNEKYGLASSITTPAYNFEDLYSICNERNESAKFDDLRKLATACSFEDAKKRRGVS